MQVRRTEVSTQIEGGDAYGYRVRFQEPTVNSSRWASAPTTGLTMTMR